MKRYSFAESWALKGTGELKHFSFSAPEEQLRSLNIVKEFLRGEHACDAVEARETITQLLFIEDDYCDD